MEGILCEPVTIGDAISYAKFMLAAGPGGGDVKKGGYGAKLDAHKGMLRGIF